MEAWQQTNEQYDSQPSTDTPGAADSSSSTSDTRTGTNRLDNNGECTGAEPTEIKSGDGYDQLQPRGQTGDTKTGAVKHTRDVSNDTTPERTDTDNNSKKHQQQQGKNKNKSNKQKKSPSEFAAESLNYLNELFITQVGQDNAQHAEINVITRRKTANSRNDAQPRHVIPVPSQFDWSPECIKKLQRDDAILNKLITHIENNTSPTNTEVAEDSVYRIYFLNFESLRMENGILYRRYADAQNQTTHYQLIPPKDMRPGIIKRIHIQVLCHAHTLSKNLREIALRAWWPEWRTQTRDVLAKCLDCLKSPPSCQQPKVAPISSRIFTDKPGVRLSFDLFTPNYASKDFRYVLVCIDNFSRFIWLFPLKDRTAQSTADCLIKLFAQHGVYRHCHSDSAAEYTSAVMQLVMAEYGIAHTRSLVYTSRHNGICERANLQVQRLMSRILDRTKNWADLLDFVASCYNQTICQSTQRTPSELHFGRRLQTAQDILMGNPEELRKMTHGQYIADVTERIQTAFAITAQELKRTAETNARRYNLFLKQVSYAENERVLVFSYRTAKQRKFARPFNTEGRILKRINQNVYSVLVKGAKNAIVVTTDKLKKIPQGNEDE